MFPSGSIPSEAIRVLNTLVSLHSYRVRLFSARLLSVQGPLMRVQPDTVQGPYLSIPLGKLHSFSLTLGTTIEHLSFCDVRIGHNVISLFQSLPQLKV